jgi:leader peptidase (prepilin peptidase) / N-methyltransferase
VLLGLAFGSFLNVCIARLPRHQSVVRPRSRCPRCGVAIRPRENIPILSWILLRGRCRRCRWRIPWRYPAVEAGTAALFLLCSLQFGLTLRGIGMAVLSFLLLGLAVMDAETMRLPDAFTLPGISLGVAWSALLRAHIADLRPGLAELALGALWSLAWAVAAALLLLAIRWAYFALRRVEGMGMGDAKLLAMIAAWLGPWSTLLTLFLAVIAAAIWGLAWIALSRGRPVSGKTRLPLGAFLCAAALYTIFAGGPIIRWYLSFFP